MVSARGKLKTEKLKAQMAGNGNSRKGSSGLVPSVDRAVQILQLFRTGDETYGVSELARRLDLNKSTLHGILSTLSYHHLLERDEMTKMYRLGHSLSDLGSRVRASDSPDLRAIAHPYVAQVARRVEETVLLGIFRDIHVYIADREEAPHDLKISANPGGRLPFNSGAFGYVFCAAMSSAQIAQLVRQKGLRTFTTNSPTRLSSYRAKLAQVRERGFALECEEFVAGVCSVAAPIVNSQGQVVAVLCVVGVRPRMSEERMESLAREVCKSARDISERIGATLYPSWNGIG